MQLTKDLRGAAALLKALEDRVAALAASAGQNGYTAPGAFLFELLGAIGLREDNHMIMADLLDRASGLLGDEAAQQGRKCVPARHLYDCPSAAANSDLEADRMEPDGRVGQIHEQGRPPWAPMQGVPIKFLTLVVLVCGRNKGASQRLGELADIIRLAFSTCAAPQGGGQPASAGYKVHVHKEKRRGGSPPHCCCAALTRTLQLLPYKGDTTHRQGRAICRPGSHFNHTRADDDTLQAGADGSSSRWRVRRKFRGCAPLRADGFEAPTLSYWCFEAGVAMRALAALRVRSVLLTSGTLSPLAGFAQELALPFPLTLENPHVIAPSQARCPLTSPQRVTFAICYSPAPVRCTQ